MPSTKPTQPERPWSPNAHARDALSRLEADPEVQAEAEALASLTVKDDEPALQPPTAPRDQLRPEDHPFTLRPGTGGHRESEVTRRLLAEAGGVAGLQRFTEAFYQKAFQDPHIDQFIREHSDPHGRRFALWIAEKFDSRGAVWTTERQTRRVCPFQSHGHAFNSPHDRSSAHFAAWHSPKRDRRDFGKHFKLDDCRIWMRLHFWALRETGMFERSPAFCDYYTKFIGHFVSIYERSAPPFARESARWSADQRNIDAYLRAGRRMPEVEGKTLAQALKDLPPGERDDDEWPYSNY